MAQTIPCASCGGRHWCSLGGTDGACFSLRDDKHKNLPFAEKNRWKYFEYFSELEQGKRTVYCASLLDPESFKNRPYHMDWALENFDFYAKNAN
jgi:hypothetical protein